jgi:hypothetical protein
MSTAEKNREDGIIQAEAEDNVGYDARGEELLHLEPAYHDVQFICKS